MLVVMELVMSGKDGLKVIKTFSYSEEENANDLRVDGKALHQ